MDQLGQTPTKQEIMLHYRKPQHGVLGGTSDSWHAVSVEVLFSTKVQLYQIWIHFYSKVQHIPSASDYIKTYNVHTVDISTLPFTVSGLNRHYFSGVSVLQQIIKPKRPPRRKKKFANGDKGCCDLSAIGKKTDLKLDGFIQWTDSKEELSVFRCHWTPHQYMAQWRLLYPDYCEIIDQMQRLPKRRRCYAKCARAVRVAFACPALGWAACDTSDGQAANLAVFGCVTRRKDLQWHIKFSVQGQDDARN